jgi:Tfp pilus assembly protein PilN
MQEKQKRMARQAELTASLLEKVPRSFILAEITNNMPAGLSLLDLNLESKERPKPVAPNAPKTAYELQKAAREGQKNPNAQPQQPEPKLYDIGLKITGIAITDVQVAQFLKNLSTSKLLREVNLLVSEEYTQGDDKLRKFQIEMALDRGAEVKPQTQPTATAAIQIK